MNGTRWWLVPLTAALWLAAVGGALAEPKPQLPRTLREGAPRRQLPAGVHVKPAKMAAPRPTPGPSISLEPRARAARHSDERRSLELLQREIALLQRVVARGRPGDPDRADALLRLSQAYQELIWMQRQELEELRRRGSEDCHCSLEQTAYARR